jgi:transcription elongation factor SPT6
MDEEQPTEEEEDRLARIQEELEAINSGQINDIEMEEDPVEKADEVKIARNTGPYARCRKAGICKFAKLFGLSPEQFAENLREGYQTHEVDQVAADPYELAKDYISTDFTTVDEVLNAAKFVVARQIAREPVLRKTIREMFYERAKLCVRATKKGSKEIDEFHSCFTMKYIKNKPVNLLKGDEYLKLKIAEQDKLLIVSINENFEGNAQNSKFLDDIKQLYYRDEFAQHVQNWNKLRLECVEIALKKMVLPDLCKELDAILLAEAKEYVSDACSKKIYDWIKVAPYDAGDIFDDDDYEWETSKGIRIMGLAYVPDHSQAAFCVIINHDGEVTDYLRLPYILKRKNGNNLDEKSLKESDLDNLAEFIRNKKPHVVAIGGESREALMIQTDLRELIKQLVDDDKFPEINVEIVDNDFAKIYANSKKGENDFREYPLLLRQAISVARRLRDPLIEFSQLCSADEEILCLRYHTLQDQLPKEDLMDAIYTEFINRTNEVGVDINLAVQNPLTMNLVQFICGLGPRKGQALVKILKQTNQRLENRTQLVTICHMGPKVFINCSGFIKIDTNSLGDSTESYVEVLDGSRVHPETYEWARKMAVDALEYDDDGANPAGALEEILENPERLKDLDLDAFAVELEKQGFGNKHITLYDIREELECRYRDKRVPYEPPQKEQLFDMLTKESAETFYVGKLMSSTVTGISHKKPTNEQLDGADPVRSSDTDLWKCPFCVKNDFLQLGDVWEHFDAQGCPGMSIGVKLRLDNGLFGFIHVKNLSDKPVKNPEERVRPGMPIHIRIIKIDSEKFTVDCTSKTSDLTDKNNTWRPPKDEYYDYDTEETDLKKESDAKKNKARQQYTKRVIVHPSFHNISYADAVKLLKNMDQGEVIVRPSSKGTDHLTVTWKVSDDVFQHIDVREVGKENSFTLGTSLFIGNEEFEDLDEIIARHINPLASNARDLIGYKYYRKELGGLRDKAEEMLKDEKSKNPNKIHYFLSASKSYPGKFMISYQPKNSCKHEYISVTPDGFKFRQQMFENVNSLMKWFKDHYKDPLPVQTPSTPRGGSTTRSYSTPGLSVHSKTIILCVLLKKYLFIYLSSR